MPNPLAHDLAEASRATIGKIASGHGKTIAQLGREIEKLAACRADSLAREYGRKSAAYLTVTAGLFHLQGNSRPYFSVTAELASASHRSNPFCCGCMHDTILKVWPKLAPVVALHLCDDTGRPMHAEANGWYDLAGYYGGAGQQYHRGHNKTSEQCLQMFADHVRIPLEQARTLAESWRCDDDPKASRRGFGQWLETQASRFQAEADAAVALLDSLIAAKVEQVTP